MTAHNGDDDGAFPLSVSPSLDLSPSHFIQRRLAWTEVLLQDIIKEIDFAKRQEEQLKDAIGLLLLLLLLLTSARFLTETTNSRIEWFSYFSMVILISTAFFQLIYLRNFFTSKKLL
jgi:hypothetical protein